MAERLTKANWIDQGLRTFAASGVGGLKVGAMAEALKVSRGSFYWHFADITDFRSQLLQAWLERATEQVIRDVEADVSEPDHFRSLMRRAFVVQPSGDGSARAWATEAAMRSWASEDAEAAAMVGAVDRRRISYLADGLIAAGVARKHALARAAFVYWAFLGRPGVMDAGKARLEAKAIDAISDLLESGEAGHAP